MIVPLISTLSTLTSLETNIDKNGVYKLDIITTYFVFNI